MGVPPTPEVTMRPAPDDDFDEDELSEDEVEDIDEFDEDDWREFTYGGKDEDG